MSVFRNPRVLGIGRPLATVLALVAAVWHSVHAWSTWRQSEQWRTTDPPLSDYFFNAFITEVGIVVAALLAATFAWLLLKPQLPDAAAPVVTTDPA